MLTREQLREAKRLRRESGSQQQKAPAPKSTPRPEPPAPEPPAAAPAPLAPPEPTIDYSSMTKSQIQEVLKERGITYLPQSTKRILLGILKDA